MPRKKKKNEPYFGEEQEQAVIDYANAQDDATKNLIYVTYLEKPIIKMAESIIRTYKLYRINREYDEVLNDTISFLILKMNKFKPEKNKKAYSYFGTICKNYGMGMKEKDSKEMNRNICYEDISSDIEENDEYSYRIDDHVLEYSDVLENLASEIEEYMLTDNDLNLNEKKIGYALIEIFTNFDTLNIDGENKFNKNVILYTLREMTYLTTKEITKSLKKFKKIYSSVMRTMIED